MQNITILGSTGTIGEQTLDVIARHPQRYKVFALTANTNTKVMLQQCLDFQPQYAVMLDAAAAKVLAEQLATHNSKTVVLSGLSNLEQVCSDAAVDAVMAAIVGAAGLKPAMAAASAGKRILLANKETLVMAGSLFMDAVKQGGAILLPIDSEHNAIFQVMSPQGLENLKDGGVRKIILTASGGPFRQYTQAQIDKVTPAMALKHPNWVMGAKITVDSATLMNKGLEVIEAHWLFNAQPSQIEVVVHPQSVIHSMVEYVDGSVLAQLGNPDMRTPIAYGLAYPERIDSGVSSLDFLTIGQLEFEAPDTKRFPCLQLAYDALKAGGTASTILNAANEVAVNAFLNDQIGFKGISDLIASALNKLAIENVNAIEQLVEVDREARQYAGDWIARSMNPKALAC
ncbi:MAG: 1-deoxy-D-xylulose-5-phosphate reductoisomerase [Betaproteobacteria bacterium]|nr:1-deoxy-D-xylulose-5-phosphate reductoisomerase [Betaproteobacteria bacterium]MCH9848414.1 1-deoxy-D-xylulose-5-phosphate reductoisomerase [Betaproteobacteria bacterium]